MRFPRMTTRRWMVVVAVVSAIGGAWNSLQRRRAELENIAVAHRNKISLLAIDRSGKYRAGGPIVQSG
jgi:hypothetical protein